MPETAARDLAGKLIAFLETGAPPDTLPQWRLQARGAGDVVALRHAGHPGTSRVPRSRFDPAATGFVLEVEEEWDAGGESWYCRELFRADIADGSISQLAVYCTGDWDHALVAKHAQAVTLLRSPRDQASLVRALLDPRQPATPSSSRTPRSACP